MAPTANRHGGERFPRGGFFVDQLATFEAQIARS
jgi:hypothetical protein